MATPFTRLNVPDPQMQAALQDVYNKLNQLNAVLSSQASEIITLQAQVKKLQTP